MNGWDERDRRRRRGRQQEENRWGRKGQERRWVRMRGRWGIRGKRKNNGKGEERKARKRMRDKIRKQKREVRSNTLKK